MDHIEYLKALAGSCRGERGPMADPDRLEEIALFISKAQSGTICYRKVVMECPPEVRDAWNEVRLNEAKLDEELRESRFYAGTLKDAGVALYKWLVTVPHMDPPMKRFSIPDEVWEPFQDALFDNGIQGKAGSIPARSLSSGETGAGFDPQGSGSGEPKARIGTSVKASAESGVGATNSGFSAVNSAPNALCATCPWPGRCQSGRMCDESKKESR